MISVDVGDDASSSERLVAVLLKTLGSMTHAELNEMTDISEQTLTDAIESLAENGIISVIDSEDGRRTYKYAPTE